MNVTEVKFIHYRYMTKPIICFVCMIFSRPIILNECTENREDCDTNAECTMRRASFNARALPATWNMLSTAMVHIYILDI